MKPESKKKEKPMYLTIVLSTKLGTTAKKPV